MTPPRPHISALAAACVLSATLGHPTSAQQAWRTQYLANGPALAQPVAPTRAEIVHVLNRLAFGPRPGDVDAVAALGVRQWIDQQLDPSSIDDSAMDARLTALKTLDLTPAQLLQAFAAEAAMQKMNRIERQQLAAAPAPAAKLPTPDETAPTALAGVMAAPAMAVPGDAPPVAVPATPPTVAEPAKPRLRRLSMTAADEAALEEGQRNGFQRGVTIQAVGELQTAKLARAVSSKRQLLEVLVDFWSNHFNLDVHKGPVRTLLLADQRDVVRPHVLGRFRDLLEASAKSPAMLFYLDNARSTRPIVEVRGRGGRRRFQTADAAAPGNIERGQQGRVRGGVNENYARELMELHTLGVDGGYTQTDVQEVARCFTGWSFNRNTGAFQFRPFLHDDGSKVVLGHSIAAGGGIQDGETVLDILATSPATAHHLATQLSQRFVSDTPPPALVERAARVYLASGGDLRELTRCIVTSPEFLASANSGNKIKSPFEFVVSAVRALDGSIFVPNPALPRERLMLVSDGAASTGRAYGGRDRSKTLPRELAAMGEPMFGCQPPTGYSEISSSWVSTGALVERLNFALAIAGGSYADVIAPTPRLSIDDARVGEAVAAMSLELVGAPLSPATTLTIEKQFQDPGPIDLKKLSALILGSPEFQRR